MKIRSKFSHANTTCPIVPQNPTVSHERKCCSPIYYPFVTLYIGPQSAPSKWASHRRRSKQRASQSVSKKIELSLLVYFEEQGSFVNKTGLKHMRRPNQHLPLKTQRVSCQQSNIQGIRVPLTFLNIGNQLERQSFRTLVHCILGSNNLGSS